MRVVVLGAGAVGSVIGGRLAQHRAAHGLDVTLVARPAHRAAIEAHGLVLNDPAGTDRIQVDAVERIEEVPLRAGDVVVLSMKTQDTAAALDDLAACAPPDVHVVCAQNGVENERLALRRCGLVHGMCVILPATFMEPGVVDASGAPHNAILDVGRYPAGTDEVDELLAAALTASGLVSAAVPDVMRWKWTKLLMNLVNPVDALVAADEDRSRLVGPARAEAEAVYAAAGIERASDDEDRARRSGVMEVRPLADPSRRRGGGSTWQSLARGAATSEVDFLNGEIVLLGRLHGVPTPVNEALCRAMRVASASGRAPRSMTVDEVLAAN